LASAVLAALWAPGALAQTPGKLPPEIADKLPPQIAEKLAEARKAEEAAAPATRRALEAQANVSGRPRDYIVDKDRVQCPQADYQSIQEAVAASPPGSTIKVCPDLYTEHVIAAGRKLIKISGGNGEINERPRCFEPEPPDPTRDAIVDGVGRSFTLRSDTVLDGFVVLGNSFTGIAAGGSNIEIRDNLAQDNGLFGLRVFLARDVRVRGNCFRRNPIGANAGDTAPFVDIEENLFFQNSIGAILNLGGGVRFEHNVSREDQEAFVIPVLLGAGEFGNVAEPGSVSYNDSVGSGTDAAIVAGGNRALRITHNRLRQARDGIRLALNDAGDEVAYNDIRGMRRDGIRADFFGLFSSRLAFNRLTDNGQDGLNLQEFNSDNQVEHNDARRNGSDGIHSEGAEGNVFRSNVMFDNAVFDARDDRRPANRWIHNQCRTDFPPGTICGVSDPAP
jgi:parallel beta-helix repeat protein